MTPRRSPSAVARSADEGLGHTLAGRGGPRARGVRGTPGRASSGGSLECGGTERALCGAVAELAISQMNLTATGPITAVALTRADCAQAASATFA